VLLWFSTCNEKLLEEELVVLLCEDEFEVLVTVVVLPSLLMTVWCVLLLAGSLMSLPLMVTCVSVMPLMVVLEIDVLFVPTLSSPFGRRPSLFV